MVFGVDDEDGAIADADSGYRHKRCLRCGLSIAYAAGFGGSTLAELGRIRVKYLASPTTPAIALTRLPGCLVVSISVNDSVGYVDSFAGLPSRKRRNRGSSGVVAG